MAIDLPFKGLTFQAFLTRFFFATATVNMDEVPELSGLILPILSIAHLLFLLHNWPGLRDTGLILDLLCRRDIREALRYLLSISYSHSHRQQLKSLLRQRLRWTPVHELKELSTLFPQLTALVERDDGVLVPQVGPLSDLESGLWDSCDFYFGLLHARQMEGTVPESTTLVKTLGTLTQ